MNTTTLLALILSLITSASTMAQTRPVLRGQAGNFRVHELSIHVTVAGDDRASLVFGDASSTTPPILIPRRFSRVNGAAASHNGDRVAIVGESEGTGAVVVVDRVKREIVSDFLALAPAVSRSGSLVAFEQFRNRGDARTGSQYSVIDLDAPQSGAQKHSAAVFFPSDSGKHQRISDLQWVDDNTLAFVDLVDRTASAVAVRFGPGANVVRSGTRELPTDSLVVASQVDGDGPPASGLYGAIITKLPGDGLTLRLAFPADAPLRVRRVDLQIWKSE